MPGAEKADKAEIFGHTATAIMPLDAASGVTRG